LGLGFLDNLPENFIIFIKTLLKLFTNIAKTSVDLFESIDMKIKHPFFLQHGVFTVFFTPDVSQFSIAQCAKGSETTWVSKWSTPAG
jgi:hypothetical protein